MVLTNDELGSIGISSPKLGPQPALVRRVYRIVRKLETRMPPAVTRKYVRLPDFVGIGGPQSGTTWLFENLQAQQGVLLPERKELKFWRSADYMPLLWYSRFFAGTAGLLTGEVTPDYCIMTDPQIAEMLGVMPKVKLILILRDPADREMSRLRREVGRVLGQERARSLSEADWQAIWRSRPYSPINDHASNLERWNRHVTEGQLLTLFFDDLERCPSETLERAARHVGVSHVNSEGANIPRNSNPVLPVPPQVEFDARLRYADVVHRLHHLVGPGTPVDEWITRYPAE